MHNSTSPKVAVQWLYKMKQTISTILTFMILISCQNNVQENKKVDSINYSDSTSIEQPNSKTMVQKPKAKKVVECDTLPEDNASKNRIKLNYTDSNGLKQGEWITNGYKGKVVKIETFHNDTLNGYWFNWDGMQEDGYYVKGKKHGFFRVYYGDKSEQKVMQLKFLQNDKIMWFACPAADSRSAIPQKGFHTELDSVLIEAPHYNHSIWYRGLFINNSPVGKHYICDTNERLLATTNYTDSTVLFTKHASKEFIDLTKMVAVGWELIEYEN